MLNRFCQLILLSLLALPISTLAIDNWIAVGSAKARVSENTLTIFPQMEESYSKLRFHISNGDIILRQARIYLAKGEVFHINLQKTIRGKRNGDEVQDYSRTVPLSSSQQSPLAKIKVFYKFKQQQLATQPVIVELLGVPVT
ncbi:MULTISPECIES: hypothetical protein [Gammaproteobacteria]|uniref:hypothetical protein n=1 Tax=Gammaproteobacteria TaxID=1236 RepID=UPI001ADD13D9|nr:MULTISPECIES: hypothetical protein [Gammaproteobacteria]MBO9480697.1 hypothetical protein [Salinisphaera sp. G21_0]MBO9494096.1 hypothetical protein [Thalassotalea sp. G20_0]